MSDPIEVTVTYDVDATTQRRTFRASPFIFQIGKGQAIRFKRAGRLEGRMRVTFPIGELFASAHPDFARTGLFHEGDDDVCLVQELPGRIHLNCELLDDTGNVIVASGQGHGICPEPVPGVKGAGEQEGTQK